MQNFKSRQGECSQNQWRSRVTFPVHSALLGPPSVASICFTPHRGCLTESYARNKLAEVLRLAGCILPPAGISSCWRRLHQHTIGIGLVARVAGTRPRAFHSADRQCLQVNAYCFHGGSISLSLTFPHHLHNIDKVYEASASLLLLLRRRQRGPLCLALMCGCSNVTESFAKRGVRGTWAQSVRVLVEIMLRRAVLQRLLLRRKRPNPTATRPERPEAEVAGVARPRESLSTAPTLIPLATCHVQFIGYAL